ncbi:MAG: hypothetical protein IT363_13660 [Methanoregulaceae archaeon]|nr:hypothetical protein [Methanoregulaceae archaeon]
MIARVTPLDSASIKTSAGFNNLQDRLLTLVNGHPYALQLVRWLVSNGGWKKAGSEYRVKPFRNLLSALALLPEAQRVSRVVQEAVQVCDRRGKVLLGMPGLVTGLAQRLASFMSPVSGEVIELCWNDLLSTMTPNNGAANQAESSEIRRLRGRCKAIRGLLLDAHLLQQADPDSNGPSIMHPLVRSFVFSRLHHAKSEQLPHFGLSGFTSGIAAVHPGSPEAGAMIVRVIRSLCKSDQTKAAFSVLRARTEANSVCRWSNFQEYLELLVRVMNLARSQITAADFSPDDVAWLYNELGLACCCHGDMPDAFAVWNQGLEISRQIDRRHPGAHTVQSLLHLGHTYVELGRLQLAEEMLHDAARHNRQLADLDFAGRIHGYLGLVAHLRGDRAAADRQYDLSLQEIHDAGGNPRARSVFCRYRGDLALATGDVQHAKELIDQSHAIAEAAQFPDLVAFARKSRGHLYRSGGDLGKARAEYEFALSEARRFRILRLEADVHSELARFALDVGDPHTALRRAECSLRISNRLGLGLRQTHGMVVLGIANLRLGEVAWGHACLDHAVTIGRSQGYLSRVLEAERVLWECGLGPKVP